MSTNNENAIPNLIKEQLNPINKSAHRPDIDWIRTVVVLMLVPFHSAIIFDAYPSIFQIQKQAPISGMHYFIGFVAQWGMPLLFLFAGMGVWFALQKRSPKVFLEERWKRLGIPLIFGLLFLIPPMIYLLQIELHPTSLSFLQFYIQFFSTGISDFTGYDGKWTPGPLWFIIYLLLYSIIMLPLFNSIKKRTIKILATRFTNSNLSQKIAYLLFPGLLMIIASLIPGFGDKNIVYFAIFFVIGFLFASNPTSQAVIDKLNFVSLLLACMTYFIDIFILNGSYSPWTIQWALHGVIYNFGCWFWVFTIIGLGHKFIKNNGKTLQYLSEMSYPFYILHGTILSIVAFILFQFELNSILMYILMNIFTFVGLIGIYHVLIRRTRLGRILFGMKI